MSPTKPPGAPAAKVKASAPPTVSPGGTPAAPPPIKPRRRLLLVLNAIFSLWVLTMIVMYFRTVYPQRHLSKPVAPANNEMQLTKRTEAGRVSQIGCLHLKGASQLISVLSGPQSATREAMRNITPELPRVK